MPEVVVVGVFMPTNVAKIESPGDRYNYTNSRDFGSLGFPSVNASQAFNRNWSAKRNALGSPVGCESTFALAKRAVALPRQRNAGFRASSHVWPVLWSKALPIRTWSDRP